ncbi:MAG: host attachment protein [Gammaproteobacteria bacterium]|nr:host attachment protein [Gammaproteobacteria bacterium]MCW9059160.1 host attachment protein [Gammaproteobacteria bacterium]
MTKTMILVADSSRARLFIADTPKAPLREVEDFASQDGRLQEGELVSDRPGSSRTPSGHGLHAYEPPTTAQEEARIQFAKRLVERLEEDRKQGVFDQFVLVAPAAMLGKLRAEMKGPLAKVLVESLDKNLIQQSPDELRAQVNVLL